MMKASADLLAWARSRDQARRARAEAVRARLPEAIEQLVGKFDVGRVWLFGSLLDGSLGARSDIDILVEGLDLTRLLEAHADLERTLGRPVDLVPAERARAHVLHRALKGELLYDRS